MRSRGYLTSTLILLLTFAVGWLCGAFWHGGATHESAAQREQTSATSLDKPSGKDAAIGKLAAELSEAQRIIARQTDILCTDSLSHSAPSIEDLFALFPAIFPQGDWRPAEGVFEDCWFQAIDGIRLHGWYVRQPHPQAVILYVHGNAGNVTHRTAVVAHLRKWLEASVLIFDYRGYGRSEGQPTMKGLIRDARAARDYLAARSRLRG